MLILDFAWLDALWQWFPEPMRTQLSGYGTGFWAILPQIVAAALWLVLIWGLVRLVGWVLPRTLRKARMRGALVDVIRMLATVGLWLFGVLIAVTIAFPSITPGRTLTALGVGGVAIGFAFKDVFENFLAGILLLIREPFQKGDFIECEGFEGQVEDITVRDTHVRQTDGQLVVAPNALFFKNPVTIRTARGIRRTTVICGVSYDTDVDAARAVILEAVRKVDTVRDDVRDVQVFAQAFGSSSIDFEVTWWTGSRPVDIRTSRDQVVAAVKYALDDAGMEIPFPYRTLTFKEPLPLAGGGQAGGGKAPGATDETAAGRKDSTEDA